VLAAVGVDLRVSALLDPIEKKDTKLSAYFLRVVYVVRSIHLPEGNARYLKDCVLEAETH
jgi:hypothetical protein